MVGQHTYMMPTCEDFSQTTLAKDRMEIVDYEFSKYSKSAGIDPNVVRKVGLKSLQTKPKKET